MLLILDALEIEERAERFTNTSFVCHRCGQRGWLEECDEGYICSKCMKEG